MDLAYLIVKFLLAAFAVYRLARMVAREEGPFSLFVWVREHVDYYQKTWIGRGINCPLCVGFWLSVVPAVWIAPSWGWVVLLWFSIAGAQAYLQETEGKL